MTKKEEFEASSDSEDGQICKKEKKPAKRIRPTKIKPSPSYPSLAKCIAIKRLLEGLELPPPKQKKQKKDFEPQTEEREEEQEKP